MGELWDREGKAIHPQQLLTVKGNAKSIAHHHDHRRRRRISYHLVCIFRESPAT